MPMSPPRTRNQEFAFQLSLKRRQRAIMVPVWCVLDLLVVFSTGLASIFPVVASDFILYGAMAYGSAMTIASQNLRKWNEIEVPRQRLEHARTAYFNLAKYLEPKDLLADKGTTVTLQIWPEGLALPKPIHVPVDTRQLYRSSVPMLLPKVQFPLAEVDKTGRITSYGQQAVLYGADLPQLPIYKDVHTKALEAPYLWQVPQHLMI